MGYAPTYHPGTPMVADARRVAVVVGQETPNVDIDLAPARIANISGTAVSSQGKPLANAVIVLTSPLVQAGVPVMTPSIVRPDGTFTISNVAPGEYRLETHSMADLQALGTGNTNAMTFSESASLPLVVNGEDLPGVRIVAMPATTATGRVILEGEAKPALAPAAVTIAAVAPEPGSILQTGTARVRDDWTFEARGLTERRYFRVNAPSGWYLKTVLVNGVDVTDVGVACAPGEDLAGIEIVLSRRLASVGGTVQTNGAKPAADYTVVLFAEDAARWSPPTRFIRTAGPDQTGRFTIAGVPAERYLIAAIEYLEPGEEANPVFLEQLRGRATRLQARDGEAQSVTLTLLR
jgi:hypothetical protein